MISSLLEKKLLQSAVTLACLVPLCAGLRGALQGAMFLGGGSVDLDSHMRYLCGLLLGIGLGFLSTVPRIEHHTARFGLLTLIVFIGGLARLLGLFLSGIPDLSMLAALGMEVLVTPLLCLWQRRVARRHS